MSELNPEKQYALEWIDEARGRLSDFQLRIWNYAEPAWREYRSAEAYRELLRREGFEVEEGSGGMPTAFVATYGGGSPVLGSYAEYDAVPANSQQPVARRAPREGLHPWAAGHTDPHSMLGVAALAGVLATKRAMDRYGFDGTIKFFGEPAEKVCGSKPVHAAKGYYDDLDAVICYHPYGTNTVNWDTHCGSYWSVVFTFECADPEGWIDPSISPASPKAKAHTTARAPGAIDALCLMYTNTKYTKEAMFPRTGTWTLNEFIMVGGDATSDNLPPRFSQIQYSWRSPTLEIQQQIYDVLANNAKQAAATTGCEASARWITKTRVGLPNRAMAELTYRNLALVGPPEYDETAKKFAREIQQNLGLSPMDEPLSEGIDELVTPEEDEAQIRSVLPDWQRNFTSDDYVDYTWHAPAARLYTARPVLRPPSGDYAYPAWTTNALGGRSEVIDPGMFVAGKTIAATMLDLLMKPEEVEKAKSEFAERTGGGIGGSKWVAPLLPSDFTAPVDLRWPEYVRTERGEEWWIPSPNSTGSKL